MLLKLLIASTVSTAAPVREAPTVTLDAVAVVTDLRGRPAASDAKTRYCIVDRLPGSLIPTRFCHTASEWIAIDGAVPTGRIARR
ncbi:hypothetical protein SOM26_10520 [Sphingomonas sp. CFBP8993]|uniref:hypothetical protein n=1 Tax=Sphingomonas sp. CFBP8993 TaxID=3096526 RepID=UPI002A698BF5|nr:hypothetical protein [Sphingomonas sp. CFBP8993]MDY0959116.1 hypothetical protein [Sphingomonas sp. CFBP8993]